MLLVRWSGRPPDGKTIALLRERGMEVAGRAGPQGKSVVAEVVSTAARGGEPRWPADVPWIWLAAAAVAPDAARSAVVHGAYDVIDGRGSGAADLLARRLAELAITEPPLPPADSFVAESEAAKAVLREVAHAARTSMPVLLTGRAQSVMHCCLTSTN